MTNEIVEPEPHSRGNPFKGWNYVPRWLQNCSVANRGGRHAPYPISPSLTLIRRVPSLSIHDPRILAIR